MHRESNGKRPVGFVLENVKGILSTKTPNGNKVHEEIKKIMTDLGYETTHKLIRSSDYGVPQNRQRVIMVGMRDDLPPFDFSWMDHVVAKHILPNALDDPYELTLGSVLCDIPQDAPNFGDTWRLSPAGLKMIESIGFCADGREALSKFQSKVPLNNISETVTQGRSWKSIPYEDMPSRFRKIYDNPQKYRAPNFYRRFALGEICGTITASGQPENCGITHPFENRRFSVREIARIQSFPDDFDFSCGAVQNSYKVIGNAVPPILGWVIAKAIEGHLKEAKNEPKRG